MAKLTVFFDGACTLCRSSVDRIRRKDPHGRIEFLDLHDPSVPSRFPQVDSEQAMRLMQAVDSAGGVYSGVDALVRIGLILPGWNLLAWILLVPGIHSLAQHLYAWVARNRYRWNREICDDTTCALHVGQVSAAEKNAAKKL